ncbi:MAG: MATE family efflux transporter [Lachnospiraceae bacterium]|nr:MATE family efflux transporter [Lachnospiraceae bacterium]
MAQVSADEEKTALFEHVTIPHAVMTLAIPTVLSSLVMVLYNLADTYFVGYLNDPVQNAAVTLAAPVVLAFNAVNNLFGVGAGTAMSRGLGRKDYDSVTRISAFGFHCALICAAAISLCLFLFRSPLLKLLGAEADTLAATGEYLFWTGICGAIPAIMNVVMANMFRSEGSTLHASIGTMSGCILNMILDPIFILPFGFNMGAAGAGLATFISNCAAFLYFLMLVYARKGRSFVCVDPHRARPTKVIAVEIFSVGIPASIQNLLNVTGMTIQNNLVAAVGSASAVAAMGIAQKLNMIPMYIGMGVSQGIMPLMGYNYACHVARRMRECLVFTLKITMGFMVLMALGYYTFAVQFIGVFIQEADTIRYGTAFLRAMCFSIPFMGIDFLGVGIYQACGRGSISFIFAVCRKIVLEIPALLILNAVFSVYGLGYAVTITEASLAVAAIFVLRKLFGSIEEEGEMTGESH